MELTRVEAEAKTDVDLGDDSDYVKSLKWTTLVTQYFKECPVKDEALECSDRWIRNCTYKRARERQGEFFGQMHIVTRSFLEGLFTQARQTTHTAKSLSDLCIKTKGCELALTRMNCRIVRSPPYTMQNQWAEVTDRKGVGTPTLPISRSSLKGVQE
ncbi:unnamed protein product [Schistocephalus solidus]|uniref:DDE-1 domain-containing protein n=1 Tax=Schistocephalus solidus TaxID=70667 RepID=A0A183T8V3_SCHSO|nr:unnamed protein product [Schistocephalus solidus]